MLLSTFHYQPCLPTVRQPPVRPWNATQRRFSSAKLLHGALFDGKRFIILANLKNLTEGKVPMGLECQSHIRGISGYLGSLAIRFSDIPTKKVKVT